jgi:protocatechuate 3,4-dioxygenase, alpha subunit
MKLKATPSQTVGPFFHYALLDEDQSKLVAPDHPSAIRIEGRVRDGAGEVVPDAMLEIWQANAAGRYAHLEDDREDIPLEDGFYGFGRCSTDVEGRYGFITIKPGVVPGPEGQPQAPHILVSVFARGLLKQLVTRIYFPDEEAANSAVLRCLRTCSGRSSSRTGSEKRSEAGPGCRRCSTRRRPWRSRRREPA